MPEYVLDIATGTGIWALEFGTQTYNLLTISSWLICFIAERYPDAYVIGSDLSAIQPDRGLPNCHFVKDDAEAEWLFSAPGKPNGVRFDYIHLRLVMSCFDDTRQVMRQSFDNMTPGGWIEFQDMIIETQAPNNIGSPLSQWWDGMNSGSLTLGRDLAKATKYKIWLEDVGCKELPHLVKLMVSVLTFGP